MDADVIYRYTQETEFGHPVRHDLVGALLPGRQAMTQPEQIQGMDLQRAHVLTGFASLIEASHRPGPTFTLARDTHYPRTHSTWTAQAHRGAAPGADGEEEYVIELEYTNRRALEVIDEIIERGARRAGADHPCRPMKGRSRRASQPDSENFQWLEATDDEIAWKFHPDRLPPARRG